MMVGEPTLKIMDPVSYLTGLHAIPKWFYFGPNVQYAQRDA
jgi:hypothetical protein